MRVVLRVAMVIVAVLAGISPWMPRPAHACSPIPGYNPVSDSNVIVAGRILDWERTGQTGSSFGAPIRLRMAVDWVFKGAAEPEVIIEDSVSLTSDGRWGTTGGLCAAIPRDPTGVYVVTGLNRGERAYGANLFQMFAFGAEPGSPAYQAAVDRITRAGESWLNLAEPRPCVPASGQTECTARRLALWNGEASAWAAEGVIDADARLSATLALRAGAGDQATLAAFARAMSQPYVQVRRVRYLAESVPLVSIVSTEPHEFVELVNLGGADQDLTGWTVHSPARGVSVELPAGRLLRPRELCRISPVHTGLPSCGVLLDAEDVWPDEEGRVLLVDAEGVVRADLLYSADPYNQPPPPNLEGVRLPR